MPHIHDKIDFTVAIFVVQQAQVLLVHHRALDKWLRWAGISSWTKIRSKRPCAKYVKKAGWTWNCSANDPTPPSRERVRCWRPGFWTSIASALRMSTLA